jgi:tetratricopeptide (TPR) repeat protein
LARLASVAYRRDEYRQAVSLLEESLALSKEMGYRWDYANILRLLGLIASYQGDFATARRLLEDSYTRFQEVGTPYGVALVQSVQGLAGYFQGDLAAESLILESLQVLRTQEDREGVAFNLTNLARLAHLQGQEERATDLLQESLAIYAGLGEKSGQAQAQVVLGHVQYATGENTPYGLERAEEQFRQALSLFHELGSRRGAAEALEGLAGIAARRGQPERAARLFGAAEGFRLAVDAPLPPAERTGYRLSLEAARAQLDEHVFTSSLEAGRTLADGAGEKALRYALEEVGG